MFDVRPVVATTTAAAKEKQIPSGNGREKMRMVVASNKDENGSRIQ